MIAAVAWHCQRIVARLELLLDNKAATRLRLIVVVIVVVEDVRVEPIGLGGRAKQNRARIARSHGRLVAFAAAAADACRRGGHALAAAAAALARAARVAGEAVGAAHIKAFRAAVRVHEAVRGGLGRLVDVRVVVVLVVVCRAAVVQAS